MARRVVATHTGLPGASATYSTFVDLGGIPHQYALPLTLLPIPRAELPPRLQPLSLYPPPNTAPAQSDHSVSQEISPAWHVKYSSPHPPLVPLPRLNNTFQTENVEPPNPEKPKWEEEAYPEIGKGNFIDEVDIDGAAIDILSNHLPFLLIQPLPTSILASKIEVRLFPTTHPNLPSLRLGKFFYRTFFRTVRWCAPVFLNRTLRSFGSPSGIKGIGLEITSMRVIKIEGGRRVEARWRTASSPWSTQPDNRTSDPGNKVEDMPRSWSGWFYFDIDRHGKIVRHVVENVNNQRKVEGATEGNNLKDILVRTVSNGRAIGHGFGSVKARKEASPVVVPLPDDGMNHRWMRIFPRIFPTPSPSNIMVSVKPYC